MTEQTKKEITTAAVEYMNGKGLSQNAMCTASKINVGYLSYMLKGQMSINGTEIADKWYSQLAEYIGFKVDKPYWETKSTPQFLAIIAALQDAKAYPKAYMLIAPTGYGKTFTIDKFVNQHPVYTYRVTVGGQYRLSNIINELCDLMGVDCNGMTIDKVIRMTKKLAEIRRSGGKPVIIIDEAENLKTPVIQLLKSIYDKMIPYASIVLIGTDQLIRNLNYWVSKGITGMPQFQRRFKAGIRYMPGLDATFDQFLSPLDLEKGLVKLLQSLCNNYGELHDFLEPVIREADHLEVKVSEDLFRRYHNMPKEGRR
jgi:DNA transposition AAA+ family ATPase